MLKRNINKVENNKSKPIKTQSNLPKIQKHKIKECDNYIKNHPSYDSNKYGKRSQYGNTQYETLCTYIRNAIDHPDSGNTYTKEELRTSIEFLIELCKENDT